jgi:predicted RNA-binding protein Jag
VFLFGVSPDKLETAQAETGLTIEVAKELRRATLVLTTKNHYRRGAQLVRVAESTGTPVYVLRKNTMNQVMDFLRTLAREQGMDVRPSRRSEPGGEESTSNIDQAMEEAESAAQRVAGGEFSVQLSPQRAYVRRLQHMLAERFSLASTSRGREPERSVLIYRP